MASLGKPDDMGGMELNAAMASSSVACQRAAMQGGRCGALGRTSRSAKVRGSDVKRSVGRATVVEQDTLNWRHRLEFYSKVIAMLAGVKRNDRRPQRMARE